MKRIKIDKNKCMACYNCILACMMEHNEKGKDIYSLDLEDKSNECRNHIEVNHSKENIPIFCRHCDEPECVNTCMSGAMKKNPHTGYVEYDEEKCASCFMCVMSCKYGVLKIDEETKSKIVKCDMCENRETPRCVENCPTRAIYFEEV
ncbi:4Fe-4S dicluster domain-containing protein [Anaeromicrobium sediminis]|uniref:4Fe-4S ferredoxin n=1 Tax=Anaeromicrobium sediminis TaxID=1478221 RepID=A0A267MM72_9FIRM|nr:4Fe-4S dicluster domain-containing protein [Anaeromicrobium sediminis]PAB59903.1 4Fe-4S ferredoxin [Anaeromicrobium sediminis]